jgi:sterol desaturase/sphingolipid hydroxylase (fatty acid hydroxylase superfamily)
MQRVVDSGHVADPPSKRTVQLAVFGVFSMLAAIAWALESSILLPTAVTEYYRSLQSNVDGWALDHLPSVLLPFLRSVASVALSPLLYLGFATVLLAERLGPADEHQRPLSRGLVYDGLAWYLLNAPLAGLAFAGTLALMYVVVDRYLPFVRIDPELTGRLPTWLLVAAAVVLGDFMKWVHHNMMHRVPLLWHFHSVHHSQRELNLFTQARFHALELLLLAPIMYLPLVVLNLDFELAVWVALAIEWYSRITHANLRTHFGPLRYALVTPQSHRVHHSREQRHHDQNFGTLFSIWDRLFGTQWPDHEEYPATGIADENFPWEESIRGTNILSNYFAQLIYPFQRLVKPWWK